VHDLTLTRSGYSFLCRGSNPHCTLNEFKKPQCNGGAKSVHYDITRGHCGSISDDADTFFSLRFCRVVVALQGGGRKGW
jgi:hypothetical protein